MESRVVPPDSKTLHISRGDWLLVKKRLNHGERAEAYTRMYLAGSDGRLHVNPLKSGMTLVTTYLLDWSLIGLDGKPLVIRDKPVEVVESMLNAIGDDDFVEIKTAIEQHDEAMTAERAAEKQIPFGASELPAISQSPDVVAGATSGSEI